MPQCKTGEQALGTASAAVQEYPQNIVLMIGDGMGLSQVTAALYSNNNKLNLLRMPVVGFQKTHSADNLVTDSAGAATAMACGVKTYNNAIGVDIDTLPCRTILEEASARGWATGMVVSATLAHATPAAFMAHRPARVQYEDIVQDYMNTDFDLLIGGGKRYFDRRENDEVNLYRQLTAKGYSVLDYSRSELADIRPSAAAPFVYFTADNHPLPVAMGRDYLPYASDLATKFLERRRKKGFFLMIEGSQIDWGGHAKDGKMVATETLDFDRAVAVVLDFAQKRGNTLVIVTADHETGGLALNEGSKMNKPNYKFTSNGHTAAMVPVFAFGPQAALFAGIYDNTAIYHKMRQALWQGE